MDHMQQKIKLGIPNDSIVIDSSECEKTEDPNLDLIHYGGELVCESASTKWRRRIVACVNACAGIPTNDLEAVVGDATPVFELVMRYAKQRDDLLAAVEPLAELCDQLCRWDRRFDDALDAVDAAIASVKGGA